MQIGEAPTEETDTETIAAMVDSCWVVLITQVSLHGTLARFLGSIFSIPHQIRSRCFGCNLASVIQSDPLPVPPSAASLCAVSEAP